eukprot:CAMPEP_0118968322 /NCGR_PEP_ID=MMETSP1173-20130426/5548_1 /TAXON_ID=1034831 /ORGANISM="Rhizochromulina marina cf, Strain CCMP1243" /LENGTH=87 /DNA_ID=CAMNT_0006917415 /DNA_START=519 /DNA_END=778 /DNA_ORIENTATION=+
MLAPGLGGNVGPGRHRPTLQGSRSEKSHSEEDAHSAKGNGGVALPIRRAGPPPAGRAPHMLRVVVVPTAPEHLQGSSQGHGWPLSSP